MLQSAFSLHSNWLLLSASTVVLDIQVPHELHLKSFRLLPSKLSSTRQHRASYFQLVRSRPVVTTHSITVLVCNGECVLSR